jgi:dienelactone hydrolase
MTVKTNQVLQPKNKNQKPIVYDLYYKDSEQPLPVVIFAHGYKGFKDWGPWHLVAEAFADAGFCFIKFNFSHNGGTVEQPIDFPDLEAFAQNNYSIELDDLKRVIDFVESENGKSLPKASTISLIGHSRGGGVCLKPKKILESTRLSVGRLSAILSPDLDQTPKIFRIGKKRALPI